MALSACGGGSNTSADVKEGLDTLLAELGEPVEDSDKIWGTDTASCLLVSADFLDATADKLGRQFGPGTTTIALTPPSVFADCRFIGSKLLFGVSTSEFADVGALKEQREADLDGLVIDSSATVDGLPDDEVWMESFGDVVAAGRLNDGLVVTLWVDTTTMDVEADDLLAVLPDLVTDVHETLGS